MSMDTVFEDDANKDINSIKSINEFVLKLGKKEMVKNGMSNTMNHI